MKTNNEKKKNVTCKAMSYNTQKWSGLRNWLCEHILSGGHTTVVGNSLKLGAQSAPLPRRSPAPPPEVRSRKSSTPSRGRAATASTRRRSPGATSRATFTCVPHKSIEPHTTALCSAGGAWNPLWHESWSCARPRRACSSRPRPSKRTLTRPSSGLTHLSTIPDWARASAPLRASRSNTAAECTKHFGQRRTRA